MSKTSKPFLAHSELTDCIYIIYGNDKYEVTEQCIKAMKATNRMPNVLEKIRSEIEREYKVESENPYGQGLRLAMEIIDKYRESEDKDGD